MSDSSTRKLLSAYHSMRRPSMFLSGLFSSPPMNFHNSEEIEIDIVRNEEEVAIVIQDVSGGYRYNAEDIGTNKAFKPPVFKEAIAISSFDLLKRSPGADPFQDNDFRAGLITRMFSGMSLIEAKIRRSMEWQASQVLQTGIVTLVDSAGTALYTLDYKPKATHLPTSGTTWGAVGADIPGDINALAEINRNDGLMDQDQLIMGSLAFEEFVKDTDIKDRFDNRRMNLGQIASMQVNTSGGIFRGVVEVGNYHYDVWTYGGRFKHPQTGVSTKFIDDGKVVIRASGGRLDATFGAIPNIGSMLGMKGARLLDELPPRFSDRDGGMDMHTNMWLSNDGEQIFGGVGARPLMIPTAIDTYGCLDTGL